MITIYLDNFRGFSNSFIRIKEINFLVGENSTGKSSLLSVINLFSNPVFWFNQDFNLPNIELGYFDDIVSKFSANKSYFTIGYFIIKKNLINSIVMKFVKKDMNPQLDEFRFITGNLDIHGKLIKNNIYYKQIKIDKKTIENDPLNFITSWINNFNSYEWGILTDFNKIKVGSKSAPSSIIFIKNLIKSDVLKEKPDFETFDIPVLFNKFAWVAPIRTKPKTIYEGFKFSYSPEGEHIPFLLRNILGDKRATKTQEIMKFITDFGSESGLFQSILVKKYGKSKASPFEINIMLNDLIFKIANVGYGVSQALPVLIDSIALSKGYWIAIQQPEIHLHPRAQASLGEIFYALHRIEGKKFLIETHSDYLIDRFRICQKKNKLESNAQVIFFERDKTGNKAQTVNIEEDGNYSEDQPDNFRSFFIKEQLSILEI